MRLSRLKIALLVLCCLVLGFEIWRLRVAPRPAEEHTGAATQRHKPEFALLPEAEIGTYAQWFAIPQSQLQNWEPTVADMNDAEGNLSQIAILPAEDGNPQSRIDDPHQYFRQYLAVVANGKKTLFLNAFCTDEGHSNDWRKHLIFVYDGGKCFWHAVYDQATQKFSELQVNGVA